MPVAWHPNRWWDWCMSEDERKRNKFNVYWRVVKVCVGNAQYEGTETFWWRLLREYIIGGIEKCSSIRIFWLRIVHEELL